MGVIYLELSMVFYVLRIISYRVVMYYRNYETCWKKRSNARFAAFCIEFNKLGNTAAEMFESI